MERLPLRYQKFQYQKRNYWEFYCPICKTQRRSFYWPSPQKKHYAQLAISSLFLALALWPWVGFRGVFLSFPLWACFEFIYRSRARQSLICPHCNFDPYLYKYNVELAKQKVVDFFEDKKKKQATKTTNALS